MKVKYFQPFVGVSIREFTKEEHGEKFEALAQEFAVTNRGKIVEEEHKLTEEEQVKEDVEIVEDDKEGKPKRRYVRRVKVNMAGIVPQA